MERQSVTKVLAWMDAKPYRLKLVLLAHTAVLKSAFFPSRSQAEDPHILFVLPIGDEFRERIVFG